MNKLKEKINCSNLIFSEEQKMKGNLKMNQMKCKEKEQKRNKSKATES